MILKKDNLFLYKKKTLKIILKTKSKTAGIRKN